jgi:K319-like protein
MQFTLPVGEFIFPENTVYGDPALLVVPNNLQDFPFLAQGEGPWRGRPENVVGQLTPFPLTDSIPGLTPSAPVGFACPANGAPSALVTPPNQTVSKNQKVTLSAASSHSNPLGDALGFQWVQLSGPPVTLADPFSATTTFQAPNVTVNTGLTFDVLVTDLLTGQQAKATTLITVTPFQVRADTVVITSALYKERSGVVQVNATSSDQTCAAILTLQALASNGAPLLPANTNMQVSNIVLGGCAYTFQSGKAIFPPAGTTLAKITVISSEGGSDVCPNGTSCAIVFK